MINYGQNSLDKAVYSLRPQVTKIIKDTGWQPKVEFLDGIGSYEV